MKKAIVTDGAPGALGPYSQGVVTEHAIYVSGQVPVDPVSGTVPEGISAQAERSLMNIRAILEAAGSSMDEVVEVQVFLKDMNDFKLMNEVYQTFFSEPYPARAAVEVARLPMDVLVEIKATATR